MSQDNFNDDDDDFGDFGGFEAADPVSPQEAQPLAQGVQASPSPWALFPGTSPAVQSDSQQAGAHVVQNAVEPHLSTANSTNKHQQDPPFQANIDTQEGDTFQGFQAFNQAEVLPGHDGNAAVTASVPPDVSQTGASSNSGETNKLVGAFDEALADTDEEKGDHKREEKKSGEKKSGDDKKVVKPVTVQVDAASPSKPTVPNAVESNEALDQTSLAQTKANNEAVKHLTRLQDKLRLTEQDRSKLQKELEEVKGLQKQLQGELVQLHEQTARYEQLQAKHATQLEEMRKAGHDALVLIVEEYKELCKTAVLQQQEASQKDLQEYLKQQTVLEEKRQKEREEEMSRVLESERKNFEEKLHEELSKIEEKHKEELKTAIIAESDKAEDQIKQLVEAEKEKSASAVEQALREERNKNQKIVEEQKKEFLKLLSEERANSKKELEKALEEEKDKMKEGIKEAVTAERERSEDIQKKIRLQIKSDLENYVKQQKQEDLLVRKRQLTSMDLFLESAREQLKLLMSDTEPTVESS